MQVEPLEQRQLLAISPSLVAIIPNEGDVLLPAQTRNTAPSELTFRFNEGQTFNTTTLGGVQLVRSGGDGVFGDGDDVVIAPGFIGIGEVSHEIVMRFAETLPDDQYRIRIVGSGAGALENIEGDAFNNGVDYTQDFRLDLGARIVGIVPQPVSRNAQGQLTQRRDQIVVYFNNDRLDLASAQNPAFYQLMFTNGSASNADDVRYLPTSVVYDPTAFSATLTFASAIDQLGSGAGTFRLRVGDSSQQLPAPIVMDLSTIEEAGSSLGTSVNVGILGAQGYVLTSGEISPAVSPTNFPYTLNYPGGNDEPGHRDIPAESHLGGQDTFPGIQVIPYNFQDLYGFDPLGNPLFNVITETQKQRAREVFEIYSYYLGVQFIETADSGFTIVTGDLRAIAPTVPTGPGGVAGIAGGGIAIMDNAENWGNSEYGGGWFETAMHEIGHLLGLGHTYDLPPLTVQGSSGVLSVGTPEGVFPGDHDIVHGRHLYRPESKDVDFYQFRLTSAGQFSAEIIAERRDDLEAGDNVLDAVVTLFDANGNLVARSDDYFSSDSFLDLKLAAGTYYVAVSSTGNTNYDPKAIDSGLGGTTQGKYDLRLNFVAEPTGSQLVDMTGTVVDGDADGAPGGAFNFWFDTNTTANTIYVDKAANPSGANGSLSKPYTRIDQALAAATPGDVVRIVGNAGVDGDINTLGDNLVYQLGIDNFGAALADGATFNVPQGVTVMIDAGAVFKLRGTNINAGSFSQGIDLGGGAIQVLGAPNVQTVFTSWNDDAVGVQDNPLISDPGSGDWGGLVFRADSDFEQEAIFKNYVGQARILYGGGSVLIDSLPQTFNPIHIEQARPLIMRNLISNSADAAISADPDAFEETLFRDNTYTARYRRIGPDIHGNTLANNSINGLFIRIRTEAGTPVDVLTVAGRFDDTDIVHVIAENLVIQGTPGGPVLVGDSLVARLDARLSIDPGVVVKLSGSRIEVGLGAQLIAEGLGRTQVVFTSLADDRYGAGNIFDTTGDGTDSAGIAGDWGGIYFHAAAKGSLDHVLLTFAGGNTPIEGSFARFNAVEIHQADVRIANSVLERNAGGEDASDRNGRGWNAASTIFVRGAQPVIVNNILRNNQGDAININANALQAVEQGDYGRTTGRIERYTRYDDNHGPLVRLNRVVDNDINGMVVRGGTLTTESVWDDTDIVHVLLEEILVPDFHTYGGLRLQSNATESLVVKLSGATAGFTASGRPLDIDDRIGGTFQVIGAPGRPVVFTSLNDATVGAGYDLDGDPQNSTLGSAPPPGGTTSQFNIEWRLGPTILQFPEAVAALERAAAAWEAVIDDPITIVVDFEFANLGGGIAGQAFSIKDTIDYDLVRQRMIADAVDGEEIVAQLPTFAELNARLPDSSYRVLEEIEINRANALALGFSPSELTRQLSEFDRTTPIDGSIEFALGLDFDYDASDGITGTDFVYTVIHEIGHVLGFVSSVDDVNFGDRTINMSTLDLFRLAPGQGAVDFRNAERVLDPQFGEHVFYDGGVVDLTNLPIPGMTVGDIPLSRGTILGDGWQASHWKYRGLIGAMSAIGIMDPVVFNGGSIQRTDTRAFGLVGYDIVSRGAPGEWRSLRIDRYANDRNVETIIESEPSYTGLNDRNSLPTNAEYIGLLAPNEKNGDDVRRLGFEIHGAISYDRPGDVDVYSFDATPGTEVWFDIDKTAASLNTVVELVDANGNVIARSDDSASETVGETSVFKSALPQYANVFAAPLGRSDFVLEDLYSTNPRDAGMRVVLPGASSSTLRYFVRVRSDSADLSNVAGGETRGEYQLQIRLRERDEIPGSTIRYSDIRYASNGIEVLGMPGHSPLAGEFTRANDLNNSWLNPQDLGNLLAADRNTISLASNHTNEFGVEWYKFTVDYQGIQSIGGFNDQGKTWAAILDIDYADGISRPDLTIWLYENVSTDPNVVDLDLIANAYDSGVAEDQPGPLEGADTDDLSRGGFGVHDPFLGSVQLNEGEQKTYYIAITSEQIISMRQVAQYFADPSTTTVTFNGQQVFGDPNTRLVRYEPTTSVKRVVEDHIGFTGYFSPTGQVQPYSGAILPATADTGLGSVVKPFEMFDLTLFLSTPGGIVTVDPTTGLIEIGNYAPFGGGAVDDIAMRTDGFLFGTQSVNGADNAVRLVNIHTGTGQLTEVGLDGITDRDPMMPDPLQTTSDNVYAMAYQRAGVGSAPGGNGNTEHYSLYYAVADNDTGNSVLYRVNPTDGVGAEDGTPWGPVTGDATSSQIEGGIMPGFTTGMAFLTQTGRLLTAVAGAQIADGDTFEVTDTFGNTVVFEFDSDGVVDPANVGIVFDATLTVDEIVDLIIDAVNNTPAAFPLGVTAVLKGGSGAVIVLDQAADAASATLNVANLPDDGEKLYGVNSSGQLYTIDLASGAATLITAFAGMSFSGLTVGPQNLDLDKDGVFGDLRSTLFAITDGGDLVSILPAAQTAAASVLRTDVFGGVNMVSTGVGATGLAFSPVDFNLWHPTRQGNTDQGHGINEIPERLNIPADQEIGRDSFYFGLENRSTNAQDSYLFWGNAQWGATANLQDDLTAYTTGRQARPDWLDDDLFAELQIGNNYNTPGGAHGSLITLPFSLAGYQEADNPTLYFNYLLESQDANGSANVFDAARVFVTTDGGLSWSEVATNNATRNVELPLVLSRVANKGTPDPRQGTQEIFESTRDANDNLDRTWRQARIDLGPYAGAGQIQIRFDFTTSGVVRDVSDPDWLVLGPMPFDGLGNMFTNQRALNNTFTGVYIDDIIVGFAERGERTTGPETFLFDQNGNIFVFQDGTPVEDHLVFAQLPQDPAWPSTVFVGSYQLEIRRGAEYVDGGVIDQFDTNDRLGEKLTLVIGDVVTFLDGETITISDGVNKRTFEFDLVDATGASNGVAPGNIEIDFGHVFNPFTMMWVPQTQAQFVASVTNAINAQRGASFRVAAANISSSERVDLHGAAWVDEGLAPDIDVIQFARSDALLVGFPLEPPNPPEPAITTERETFTLTDGVHSITFEFDYVDPLTGMSDGVTDGNIAVLFTVDPLDPVKTYNDFIRAVRDTINANRSAEFAFSAVIGANQDRLLIHGVSAILTGSAPTPDGAPPYFPQPTIGAIEFDLLGDSNLMHRDQGQILIHSNIISDSLGYGVVVDSGARDAANGTHPGAVANLREPNSQRLLPSAVIFNNLIVASGTGGILFSGDPNTLIPDPNDPNVLIPVPLAPVPFGRIVNNTIVGEGFGVGIAVTENAGPTLLNNVFSGLSVGVSVDASSAATTVLGGNLFQGNISNTQGTTLGSFPITLSPADPLFINAANRNFQLAPGSKAIDSSINSLADRPAMTTVKNPLGIGVSPILAPQADLTGKARVDDPAVTSPPGLGANVFKDRGALDRSDFVGPSAALVNPVPGTPVGSIGNFQVQLIDGIGSGVDDSTVDSGKFIVRRDGVVLIEGVDYRFSYDATNNVARFTALIGIWLSGHTYTITLDNSAATGLKDLAGNRLQPTDNSGITQFSIPILPLDFGDAPDPSYPTLFNSNGAHHGVVTGFHLGANISSETEGFTDPQAAGDAFDDGVAFDTPLVPGASATITVTASAAGLLDAWFDLNGDGDWDDPNEQVFASRALVAGANALVFTLPAATAETSFARFRFSSAGGLLPTGAAADGEVEDYEIQYTAGVAYTVVLVDPVTNLELIKDATGRYIVQAGATVRARVYVDDLRSVGAAGGVFAGFADLVHDAADFDWQPGSLVVAPGFGNSQSGTVVLAEIDEAGGVGPIGPVGANPKQLLFHVDGTIDPAIVPGSVVTFATNAADDAANHGTLIYGLDDPVLASFGQAKLVVPEHAWQNPGNAMDVNNDGIVVGLDVLLIINALNAGLAGPLPIPPVLPFVPPPFYDVDGDDILAPIDALIIINYLNALVGGPASSSAAAASASVVAESAAPAGASSVVSATVVTASAAPRVAEMTIDVPLASLAPSLGDRTGVPSLVDLALADDGAAVSPRAAGGRPAAPTSETSVSLSRSAEVSRHVGGSRRQAGTLAESAVDVLASLRNGFAWMHHSDDGDADGEAPLRDDLLVAAFERRR